MPASVLMTYFLCDPAAQPPTTEAGQFNPLVLRRDVTLQTNRNLKMMHCTQHGRRKHLIKIKKCSDTEVNIYSVGRRKNLNNTKSLRLSL